MVKFEFLGTDPAYPGSKIYDVEAIHVTTSGNGRKYTKDELEEATLSLAFRPLDINHDSSRILTYPDNETLMAHFDGHAIKTRIRVVDPVILRKIESGVIKNVSVSQVSNETCADSMCRTKLQYGMAFTRLALLEGLEPGDSSARIFKMEAITDLIKCDDDCKCTNCTKTENYHCPDCHKEFGCKDELKKHMMSEHGKSEYDSGCVSDCLKAKADAGHEIDDQAKAICISECSKDEVINSHNTDKDKNKEMTEISKDKKESVVTTEPATTNVTGQDMTQTGVQTKQPNIGDVRNDAASTEKQIQKETPDIHAMEPRYWQEFKDQNQKQLDKLTELIGAVNFNAVKPKNEPVTPVTKVDDTHKTSKKDEYEAVVKFFDDIRTHPRSTSTMGITWGADKEEYMQAHGYLSPAALKSKMEAADSVTTTNTFGINFSKQVLLVPGARMKVPVRQYCNFVQLEGQDTANFYTIGAVDFAAMTEGTVPTASAQTVTRVQAVPSLVGALELIGYSQIESAPYNLIDAINEANILAGIDAEAVDLLDTVWDAATHTNAVNGNTGAALANPAYDDIASMVFKRDGLVGGKRLIMKEGYDVSPGSLVLFIHPKNWQDLMLDTNMNNYYQWANPSITAEGMLERLYGVDIVIADQVKAKTNTTNNTFRNCLATKGRTFGLASGRDVLLEAQRRNEIQQVMVTGTQRVKAANVDDKSACMISAAQ